jgi:hypothetical protein
MRPIDKSEEEKERNWVVVMATGVKVFILCMRV